MIRTRGSRSSNSPLSNAFFVGLRLGWGLAPAVDAARGHDDHGPPLSLGAGTGLSRGEAALQNLEARGRV
jgi:hypothetical protein